MVTKTIMGFFVFLIITNLGFRKSFGIVSSITEYSLHVQIKNWYSTLGDEVEVKVDDFIVDVLRDDLLIEIQTRNLSAIKKKLTKLLLANRVRLVYPIAKIKWILSESLHGEFVRKRRSPKRGSLFDLFGELVHVADLFNLKNFSFEVLLIEEEELRCNDGKGSWRRRGVSIKDRKLLRVFSSIVFENKVDFFRFLPDDLAELFTNKLLASKLGISVRVAQRITYCLRKMNVLVVCGNKKRELLFRIRNECNKLV